MNASQHLLVLMSIILGLGLRELLVGGRAAAVERGGGRFPAVPYLAGLLVLIAIVQFWWYLFLVAGRGVWGGNFFLFAATLLRPVLLFLSAASVFPPPGRDADYAGHYLRNRGFIFVPLAIFEAQNLAESALNLGTLLHPAHAFHLLFIALSLLLAWRRALRLHLILLPIVLAMVLFFIFAFSLRLG